MISKIRVLFVILLAALLVAACGQANQPNKVAYTLTTGVRDGKLVYIGVGGDIDGRVDPTLQAYAGDEVSIKLTNGEGAEHNISVPDFAVDSAHISGAGKSVTVTFTADKAGTFTYFSRVPGQMDAGMQGTLVVGGDAAAAASPNSGGGEAAPMNMSMPTAQSATANTSAQAPASGADIVRDPADLPGPIGDRGPTTVRIDLEVKEIVGQLADGTTYPYWTFNGKVPGPFFRVRVGDTVEVHLKNDASSMMPHSVDFHAVTGPGGGAVMTTTPPGGETSFTFKALNPGLYMYHCATPIVAVHIANGMYGLILVEPEGGLPKVDHEYYVDQGEIYTTGAFGDKGPQSLDMNKLLNETPEYYVFNGAVNALITEHPLKASVGQTVRIFLGNAGPNKISSFHIIGEIMDRVYDQGSLTSPPLTDVQTTLVPAGGATMIELQFQVPGKYIMLDHAISRMQRGLAGYIIVDGAPAPDIYNGTPVPGSGH